MGLKPCKANPKVTAGRGSGGATSELCQRAGVESDDSRSLRLRLLQASMHRCRRNALSLKLRVKAVSDVISLLGLLDGQVPSPLHLGDTLAKDGGRSFSLLLLPLENLRSDHQLIPLLL